MRELVGGFLLEFLFGFLLALIAMPAAGHTPFEPLASSPDHVVSMIETDGLRKKQRVVTHHGSTDQHCQSNSHVSQITGA